MEEEAVAFALPVKGKNYDDCNANTVRKLGKDQLRKELLSIKGIGVDEDFQIYGWLHWLLSQHGIEHCKKVPVCDKFAFEKDCKNCG